MFRQSGEPHIKRHGFTPRGFDGPNGAASRCYNAMLESARFGYHEDEPATRPREPAAGEDAPRSDAPAARAPASVLASSWAEECLAREETRRLHHEARSNHAKMWGPMDLERVQLRLTLARMAAEASAPARSEPDAPAEEPAAAEASARTGTPPLSESSQRLRRFHPELKLRPAPEVASYADMPIPATLLSRAPGEAHLPLLSLNPDTPNPRAALRSGGRSPSPAQVNWPGPSLQPNRAVGIAPESPPLASARASSPGTYDLLATVIAEEARSVPAASLEPDAPSLEASAASEASGNEPAPRAQGVQFGTARRRLDASPRFGPVSMLALERERSPRKPQAGDESDGAIDHHGEGLTGQGAASLAAEPQGATETPRALTAPHFKLADPEPEAAPVAAPAESAKAPSADVERTTAAEVVEGEQPLPPVASSIARQTIESASTGIDDGAATASSRGYSAWDEVPPPARAPPGGSVSSLDLSAAAGEADPAFASTDTKPGALQGGEARSASAPESSRPAPSSSDAPPPPVAKELEGAADGTAEVSTVKLPVLSSDEGRGEATESDPAGVEREAPLRDFLRAAGLPNQQQHPSAPRELDLSGQQGRGAATATAITMAVAAQEEQHGTWNGLCNPRAIAQLQHFATETSSLRMAESELPLPILQGINSVHTLGDALVDAPAPGGEPAADEDGAPTLLSAAASKDEPPAAKSSALNRLTDLGLRDWAPSTLEASGSLLLARDSDDGASKDRPPSWGRWAPRCSLSSRGDWARSTLRTWCTPRSPARP